MGDSRQMQGSVGAAADCHINSYSVLEGVERHNVARQNVFFDQAHNSHACVLSQGNAFAVVGSRDSAVAGKAHAQNLGEAVHGVGGEKTGAAAAAGAGAMLDFAQLFFINLAGFKTACSFKYSGYADILAMITAGEHRAAADNNGGDVQTGCSHQHTRDDFITVRNQNQAVKGVAVGNSFNAVGNQLAACQRIFHAIVAHSDAVADADSGELDRSAAGLQNTILGSLGNGVQVHVAGDDFVSGTADAD